MNFLYGLLAFGAYAVLAGIVRASPDGKEGARWLFGIMAVFLLMAYETLGTLFALGGAVGVIVGVIAGNSLYEYWQLLKRGDALPDGVEFLRQRALEARQNGDVLLALKSEARLQKLQESLDARNRMTTFFVRSFVGVGVASALICCLGVAWLVGRRTFLRFADSIRKRGFIEGMQREFDRDPTPILIFAFLFVGSIGFAVWRIWRLRPTNHD